MRSFASRFLQAFAVVREVPIRDCVHYCAYRYGHDEPNPYEHYAISLARKSPIADIRANFVDTLSRYRPRDLGEALGTTLSRPYPLWWLPWRTPKQVKQSHGWVDTPGDVVDVMTHFANGGIPRSLLESEFRWHEDAFSSIREMGYRPEGYSYITARELRAEKTSYLLIDGNHRLSSMSALGIESVSVKLIRGTGIVRARAGNWPLVRAGMMTLDDALSVFDAYQIGNRTPMTAAPVKIVD